MERKGALLLALAICAVSTIALAAIAAAVWHSANFSQKAICKNLGGFPIMGAVEGSSETVVIECKRI